jgi:hypothetical protein
MSSPRRSAGRNMLRHGKMERCAESLDSYPRLSAFGEVPQQEEVRNAAHGRPTRGQYHGGRPTTIERGQVQDPGRVTVGGGRPARGNLLPGTRPATRPQRPP